MPIVTTPYLIARFVITLTALYALRAVAGNIGLLDFPGGRKTHLSATPLSGGLGIFAGLLLISLSFPPVLSSFAPLLTLSALVLFIGTIDDLNELKPSVRIIGHVLIALLMAVGADIQLRSMGNLLYFGDIQTGWLAIPLTLFATLGVINAINMCDGIDGLSGGLVVVALGSVTVLAWAGGAFLLVTFVSLIICSILAFLSMNFRRPWNKKALVFLGDAGSTMLGFIIAWLFIEYSQGSEALFAPVHALWFVAIPLIDTVTLLFRRPMQGRSPFAAGNDHLHHHLLSRGFSVSQVVLMLLTASVLFASVGVIGYFYEISESLLFLAFLAVFLLYFFSGQRLAKFCAEGQPQDQSKNQPKAGPLYNS